MLWNKTSLLVQARALEQATFLAFGASPPPGVAEIQNLYLSLLFPDEPVQDLETSGVLSGLFITYVGDAGQRAPSAPRDVAQDPVHQNQGPYVHVARRADPSSEAQTSRSPCPQTTTRARTLTTRCRGPARPVCSSVTRERRALIRGWRLPPRPRSSRPAGLTLRIALIQPPLKQRPAATPVRTPLNRWARMVTARPTTSLRNAPLRACARRRRRQADR